MSQLAALPLLAAVSFRLWMIWSSSPRFLSTLTPDDAYYYFGVARNVGAGLGSSFDGLTPTNGYQPLWLLSCAGLSRLLGVDLQNAESWPLLPRCALTLQLALGVIAIALLSRALSRVYPEQAGVRAIWLFAVNPWLVYSMCDGTEAGLVLCLVAAFAHALITRNPFAATRAREALGPGVWLGLACLARLDLALLIPLCAFRFWRVGTAWRPALAFLAPPLALLSLYVIFNALHFDTLIPISAWMKDSFPHFGGKALLWLETYPLQFGLALGMGLITWWLGPRLAPERAAGLRACLELGAAFCLLHAVHTLLFMRGDVWKWHFASYYPLALLTLTAAICQVGARFTAWRGLALALFVGALQIAGEQRYFAQRLDRAFMTVLYDAAMRARDELAPSARIAISDAGVFGYYRGNGVLVLDGLVLDRAYQKALVERGLQDYLRQREVDYLGARFEGGSLDRQYDHFDYEQDSMLRDGAVGGRVRLNERCEVMRVAQADENGAMLREVRFWQMRGAGCP
jgi:hypothetical protein